MTQPVIPYKLEFIDKESIKLINTIKKNHYYENTYHLLFHWTYLPAYVILPYRTAKNGSQSHTRGVAKFDRPSRI